MDKNGYKLIIENLIELIDNGVYIVDDAGKCIFYNKAMADIEKIDKNDVIGKEFQKAFPNVKLNDSTMFKALKRGIPTKEKQQTYINKYGKEVTTINSTMPIKDQGYTIGAIEVARDITNLQSMSRTLLELQEKDGKPNKTKAHIRKYTFDSLVGESPIFMQAIERAKKAAEIKASVFIYGETGTGKELFSQSIHYGGYRKDKPFLAQNCAALPPTLLEGILFGTVKGGFTGAVDRAGLFEQANGGTLLLDEISAMPYELQSKLLRVLQEDYIRRVGGSSDIPIDTRIIATVNEDPLELIRQGKLRKDLYYRLSVVNISIPLLRERVEDIPQLVEHFLVKHNESIGKELWMASDKAIERLKKYDYPGNVRELENMIMQAVAMAGKEHVLTEKHLQMPMDMRAKHIDINNEESRPLNDYLRIIEIQMIRDAMIKHAGNVSRAAEELMIKRQTLQHKIKKYGINE